MVNPFHKGILSHQPTNPTNPTVRPNLCFEVFESFRLTTDVILPKSARRTAGECLRQKTGGFEKKLPIFPIV